MKKVIFMAAIAVLGMTSCKKDRTCKCTTTVTSQTFNGVANPTLPAASTEETKYTKASKKAVDCNSGEETWTQVSGANTTIQVQKVDCSLS
ncbi:MAG: hypothetical protein IPM51_05565 [Sphingobacteriaceae bacterium]|nr:hypothetical protein [Sphingobacteriaceae bacterium]